MRNLNQLIIVHLVEKRPAGDIFPRKRANWPLHITLVPWFHISEENEVRLVGALHAYGQRGVPFVVRVGSEDKFGPHKDVPVNIILDQEPVERLHSSLMAIVRECGGTWKGAASAQSGVDQKYRAHITHHVTDGAVHRRYPGDEEQVNDITIARLLSDGTAQMVAVLEHINLGAGDEAAA